MYCPRCGTWASKSDAPCAHCGAALPSESPAAVAVAATPPAPVPIWQPGYSGFWRRFGSALVDLGVLTPFFLALEIAGGHNPLQPLDAQEGSAFTFPVQLVIGWLYCALFECSSRQGTLGQQLLAIRVTDLHGRRVSFARATGRHFGQILSALLLCIGYLMIAFTSRKQGLHDVMSGCLLVRPQPAAPTGAPS